MAFIVSGVASAMALVSVPCTLVEAVFDWCSYKLPRLLVLQCQTVLLKCILKFISRLSIRCANTDNYFPSEHNPNNKAFSTNIHTILTSLSYFFRNEPGPNVARNLHSDNHTYNITLSRHKNKINTNLLKRLPAWLCLRGTRCEVYSQ